MTLNVKLVDILSDKFFQKNTAFENFEDLISKADISLDSMEDYSKLIEDQNFNIFIFNNTKYSSFSDMKAKAAVEFMFGDIK
jgi:hypothetical protein